MTPSSKCEVSSRSPADLCSPHQFGNLFISTVAQAIDESPEVGDDHGRPTNAWWNDTMIKSELVQKITEQNPHLYQRDVENIVNAILGEIVAAMGRGDRVELRGFGMFSVRQRSARIGRNPRSGALVSVDQKYAPYFKTGKEMRERLNRSHEAT